MMRSLSPSASTAATTCGNPPVRSWSIRDQIFTRPRSRPATARMPSYFSSKTHSGPSTMVGDNVASIGRMSVTADRPSPPSRRHHLVARDPGEQSSGEHRSRLRRRDVDRRGAPVPALYQEPPAVTGPYQGPRAFELLSIEREDDASLA